MAKQSFSSGQTLTAQQMNDLQSNDFNLTATTKTADATLVVGDRGTRVIGNAGTAITFTVPDSTFTAGDTVQVHNIGAGTVTVAAGTGLTLNSADVLTLSQYQSGTVYFTSASSAILFPTTKTQTASGLTLISATTIGSAVSAVTVSSAFSSTFDNYRITLNGGVASGTITISLKLGSTTTGYNSFGVFGFANGVGITGLNANNASSWGACWAGETTNLSGNCDLYSPNLAKTTGISSWRPAHAVTTAQYVFTGFEGSTTQHTAFTVSADSGTMTGGTIRVYGYANS